MPKVDRWPAAVDELADVGKLVHLAFRQDAVDEEQISLQLLRIRRDAYEKELTQQAVRVGCPGKVGFLGAGPILSSLKEASAQDARSIVGTLNYDIASQISAIRAETPTANRYVYAKRLTAWNNKRSAWKKPQYERMAIGTARSQALSAFRQNNAITGYAMLLPKRAVCPICKGWVKRGRVPLAVATNNPPPYHPNCPHTWETYPDKVDPSQCQYLWMGE